MKMVKTSKKCFVDGKLREADSTFLTTAYDKLKKLPSYISLVKMTAVKKKALKNAEDKLLREAKESEKQIEDSTPSSPNFLDSTDSGKVEIL